MPCSFLLALLSQPPSLALRPHCGPVALRPYALLRPELVPRGPPASWALPPPSAPTTTHLAPALSTPNPGIRGQLGSTHQPPLTASFTPMARHSLVWKILPQRCPHQPTLLHLSGILNTTPDTPTASSSFSSSRSFPGLPGSSPTPQHSLRGPWDLHRLLSFPTPYSPAGGQQGRQVSNIASPEVPTHSL